MTGRVVHFEIPADDVDRARSFYRDAFGWQMSGLPEMGYTMVGTTPTGENGMPSEPGSINGGMFAPSRTWRRQSSRSTSPTSTPPWRRSSRSVARRCRPRRSAATVVVTGPRAGRLVPGVLPPARRSRAGVAGWVAQPLRRRGRGRVRGPRGGRRRVVAWCRLGPPRAEVTGIDVTEEPTGGARRVPCPLTRPEPSVRPECFDRAVRPNDSGTVR